MASTAAASPRPAPGPRQGPTGAAPDPGRWPRGVAWLLAASLLPGCAPGGGTAGLREGMSPEQVAAVLGRPDGQHRGGGGRVGWRYHADPVMSGWRRGRDRGDYHAVFEGGRLAEWGPGAEGAAGAAGAVDPRLSADLGELGRAYLLLGRHDLARPLYERLVELGEAGGGDAARLAGDLCDLALVDAAQGRPREAEAAYGRALAALGRAGGDDGPEAVRCLTNLAVLRWRTGEAGEAGRLQGRALAAAERLLGADDPRLASLRKNLALMGSAPAAAADAEPSPEAAAAPPPAIPGAGGPGGGFAVHVASVRDPASVPSEWRRLAGLHPALAELRPGPQQAVEIPGKGRFFRVLAGTFATRAEAAAACGRVRAQGRDCRAVATTPAP